MNVYLDTSALNRIFDDQSQPRIFLEASAMLLVFGLIEKRIISIVSSEVLIYENSQNPHAERQLFWNNGCRGESGGINHACVATGGGKC